MYLWRRRATPAWWAAHESTLRERFGPCLAIIEQPNRKTLQIEITCESPKELKEFGGDARKLPRDWLTRFARQQKAKPLRINRRELIIPAGAAFGTGEHATTAMSLTMLKEMLRAGDSAVDLGTGSGILALAAHLLGAKRVVAIDNDPIAIRTARENARHNRIRGVQFVLGDARRSPASERFDVLTANLFSELLIEALPKWRQVLKENARLILSGVLRIQERDVLRALRANGFRVIKVRRRGKWIAMLCSG
ncbi:MAG: 50S ribosomal protein L11 methyltransferase [Chthoniobacterales bacterium]